ncbi:MAG: putative 5'(3')-deoxyribonucleotidase [Prokaryotic dsDNA virus sp.]|nr:MAG: putative 5'(3')-deoxyribonucleotidase [Prokaryotic dsDNA virus sp.]|tara:strand:+ start:65 stop:355 length:291 start_codon:yes stop_codon:yes gene_type:complete
MLIYVDIDGTICTQTDGNYASAKPLWRHIDKINQLYNDGNTIIYWTARGARSGIDWTSLTTQQLKKWGAKYHDLRMNSKPHYDLLICDKTKRIEEV